MPLFLAALWGALLPMLGSVVAQVLLSLGIGYLTYTGIDASIGFAKAQFVASVGSLPIAAVGVMGLLNIGKAVSMLCSAVVMRLTMQGLKNGAMRRMSVKAPT